MQTKNYYKSVSENKEIVRVYMSLQGVMYLLSPDVTSLLDVSHSRFLNYFFKTEFNSYKAQVFLWYQVSKCCCNANNNIINGLR